MSLPELKRRFEEDGFIVLRGLLSSDEVPRYVSWLKRCAGQSSRWTLSDGVNRNEPFWPLIFNERLLDAVRHILGPDIRYLPHNDLHVGFSSFGWHRDNVNRKVGIGSDWDEHDEPYRLVRIGLYLHRSCDTDFRLGLIKGTHRPAESLDPAEFFAIQKRTSAAATIFSWLTRTDLLNSRAEWVTTEPGDAVLFDPRVLHTGSRFHGEKYSIFLAYGVHNRHFSHHWHYYANIRKDLHYAPLPSALSIRLRDAHLLPDPLDASTTVHAAFVPSRSYTYVARYFQ